MISRPSIKQVDARIKVAAYIVLVTALLFLALLEFTAATTAGIFSGPPS